MAVVTVYRHGVKGGMPPAPSKHERAKRKSCQGWSARSARSNLEFLRSVDLAALDGLGHCVTLTVRSCPESAAIWERMRHTYIKRLRRGGLIRLHWVTEWQRRGVPHLHGVAFFETPADSAEYARQDRLLRDAWLEVVAEYGANPLSQHVAPMEEALGWLKYLAKHAARGHHHYQRSAESIPPEWQGNTGRMWGKSGRWPLVQPVKLEITNAGWYRFRRIVRAYRLADARSTGQGIRIRSARTMLKSNSEATGQVRGVSEWIPDAVQYRILEYLADLGHGIRC